MRACVFVCVFVCACVCVCVCVCVRNAFPMGRCLRSFNDDHCHHFASYVFGSSTADRSQMDTFRALQELVEPLLVLLGNGLHHNFCFFLLHFMVVFASCLCMCVRSGFLLLGLRPSCDAISFCFSFSSSSLSSLFLLFFHMCVYGHQERRLEQCGVTSEMFAQVALARLQVAAAASSAADPAGAESAAGGGGGQSHVSILDAGAVTAPAPAPPVDEALHAVMSQVLGEMMLVRVACVQSLRA